MKPIDWRRSEQRITAVVIGAGQAGLATSYELGLRGIEHVVLERGEVANSWREERWDSMRLLTPNWQTQLPGLAYTGEEPNGYMSAGEVADFIGAYARFCDAPVQVNTRVTSVAAVENDFRVTTNRGTWRCSAVVLASGPYNSPLVPAISGTLPKRIEQLTPHQYRHPGQLSAGGVLVVGASATGVQLAREIQDSGHQVTLAVGEHVRLPRCYRGKDIQYWMHATGLLDQGYADVDDIQRVSSLPSPQLIGHPDRVDLDLNTLADQGVTFVGRLVGMQGRIAQFSGSLPNLVRMADLKQQRLLRSIDTWIDKWGAHHQLEPALVPAPTRLKSPPRLTLDLGGREIDTVIWATGFQPDYSWLKVPVLNGKGKLLHNGGITPAAGLYAMGLPFMRKRKSAFIFGAGEDAREIGSHLAAHVRARFRRTKLNPKRAHGDTCGAADINLHSTDASKTLHQHTY
jgi:putative flavoprotein involved in K+ transport